jgi:hypothetical protein
MSASSMQLVTASDSMFPACQQHSTLLHPLQANWFINLQFPHIFSITCTKHLWGFKSAQQQQKTTTHTWSATFLHTLPAPQVIACMYSSPSMEQNLLCKPKHGELVQYLIEESKKKVTACSHTGTYSIN